MIESTVYSFRVPGFDSQHPNGNSQPPIPPVPKRLMLFSDIYRHTQTIAHTDIHASKVPYT